MGFSTRFPKASRKLRASRKWLLPALVLYMATGFVAVRLVRDPVRLTPAAAGPLPVLTLPAARAPGTVVRGAISVHTGRSHDAEGTLEEVADAAVPAGLDFVLLGDHVGEWASEGASALAPRRLDGVLMIPGVEMAVLDAGRVLAVGLDTLPRDWYGTVDELIARVDPHDGFLSVVHPRSPRQRERWRAGLGRPGIDAWESFDVSEMARMRLTEPLVGYRIPALLTAMATGQGHRSLTRLWREGSATPALLAYDSVRARGPVTLTGGLNHHPKTRLFGGLFPAYQPFFRTVVNHLILDAPLPDDPVSARNRILDALRNGRLFVTLGDAEDVADFDVVVVGPDGGGIGMGEIGPWSGGARLVISLPAHARGTLPVRILQDGHEVAWLQGEGGDRLQWEIPDAGVYRVEVFKGGRRLAGLRAGFQPWIFSNPIEVLGAGPARIADGS